MLPQFARVTTVAKAWQTNSRRSTDVARLEQDSRSRRESGLASDGHFVFISKMLHELIYLFLISDQHHTFFCSSPSPAAAAPCSLLSMSAAFLSYFHLLLSISIAADLDQKAVENCYFFFFGSRQRESEQKGEGQKQTEGKGSPV